MPPEVHGAAEVLGGVVTQGVHPQFAPALPEERPDQGENEQNEHNMGDGPDQPKTFPPFRGSVAHFARPERARIYKKKHERARALTQGE
jgi:hypothetical protein